MPECQILFWMAPYVEKDWNFWVKFAMAKITQKRRKKIWKGYSLEPIEKSVFIAFIYKCTLSKKPSCHITCTLSMSTVHGYGTTHWVVLYGTVLQAWMPVPYFLNFSILVIHDVGFKSIVIIKDASVFYKNLCFLVRLLRRIEEEKHGTVRTLE